MGRRRDTPWQAEGKAIAARLRFLRRTLRELQEVGKRAAEAGSFTAAVQAKSRSVAVHAEVAQAMAEQRAHKRGEPDSASDDETLATVISVLPSLPVSVLLKLKAAIEDHL